MHAEALPEGPKNPYGNGFIGVETPLDSEAKAARVADGAKATYWKVNNPKSRHAASGLYELARVCMSVCVFVFAWVSVLRCLSVCLTVALYP